MSDDPSLSINDLINWLVENPDSLSSTNTDGHPAALVMLGMVELIRLMRNVGRGMETREQVRWPEHPDVLDRLWKEALGLHDHASKVFGAQKRYLNAARANAADPEVIDANEVRDANTKSGKFAHSYSTDYVDWAR